MCCENIIFALLARLFKLINKSSPSFSLAFAKRYVTKKNAKKNIYLKLTLDCLDIFFA